MENYTKSNHKRTTLHNKYIVIGMNKRVEYLYLYLFSTTTNIGE